MYNCELQRHLFPPKALHPTMYNAGVVVVNSEVVGLASGINVMTIIFGDIDQFYREKMSILKSNLMITFSAVFQVKNANTLAKPRRKEFSYNYSIGPRSKFRFRFSRLQIVFQSTRCYFATPTRLLTFLLRLTIALPTL
jgi:hypothetical protein